jgi:MoaA/NifB/PqqE/SkfB family radical SAM enzyme
VEIFTAKIKRIALSAERRVREIRMVAKTFKGPRHPVLVHIVPTRRCNLACRYCNEYDNFSQPVATAQMLHRIDLLAALGTAAVHLSGGEPLLHPELDTVIQRIRKHGMFAGVLTNGYGLSIDRIQRLNRSGLDYLQISVDNVEPDEISKKSLKVLDQKLQWLAAYAHFSVNINSVLGSSIHKPEDALLIAKRAQMMGFNSTVGMIHDHAGQLRPLGSEQKKIYDQIVNSAEKRFADFVYYSHFQNNLAQGLPNDWQCHAGSRYLYVCEDGLVHYCSQRRGYPAIPLEQYTTAHLEHEYNTRKPCAPYCTVGCVHRVSVLDEFRENPRNALSRFFPQGLPASVRILKWLFLPKADGRKTRLANLTVKLLRMR